MVFMKGLRFILFGSPRLENEGHVVRVDTRKALALFAFLVLTGQEQQRDRLVTLLYPEADPTSARAAFRRTLSTLNSALGQGILSIRRDAVGVAKDADLWVDVLQFGRLVEESDHPDSLEQAVALYQEDFMTGFSLRDSPAFDEWQYQQAEDLRRAARPGA